MHRTLLTYLRSFLLTCLLLPSLSNAAQLDIPDPTGSGLFGSTVTVLPNGNFVVTDPGFDLPGPISDVGAAYLYQADGSLISTLTGSLANDRVGISGVTVLANGNYVVSSTLWNVSRGAATWGSATSGVAGLVSDANPLVGGSANDAVGSIIIALSNGNYVVPSQNWDAPSPVVVNVGAVTWGNGSGGTVGLVSPSNSLVGASTSDAVGSSGVTALSNGNYVVATRRWNDIGAATWGNGNGGTVGMVSAANSLVGSTAGDQVGAGITALSNGNYVVVSGRWSHGATALVGAVTWGSGFGGISGPVSASNSLIGSSAFDQVGNPGVSSLSNGNYVVRSRGWSGGTRRGDLG